MALNPFAAVFSPSKSLNPFAKVFSMKKTEPSHKRKLFDFLTTSHNVFMNFSEICRAKKKTRSCTVDPISRDQNNFVQSSLSRGIDNQIQLTNLLMPIKQNFIRKVSNDLRNCHPIPKKETQKKASSPYTINVQLIKDHCGQPKRMVGHNVMYSRSYHKSYFILDLCKLTSNLVKIHTNCELKNLTVKDIPSLVPVPRIKYIVSQYLERVMDIYWFIDYKTKRKYFKRLVELIRIKLISINARLNSPKQRESETKTFIRFSYKKTVIYLGIYVPCGICSSPCAVVKSRNRSYCHNHFNDGLLEKNKMSRKRNESVYRPINGCQTESKIRYSQRKAQFYIRDLQFYRGYLWKCYSTTIDWAPNVKQQRRIDRSNLRFNDSNLYYKLIRHYNEKDSVRAEGLNINIRSQTYNEFHKVEFNENRLLKQLKFSKTYNIIPDNIKEKVDQKYPREPKLRAVLKEKRVLDSNEKEIARRKKREAAKRSHWRYKHREKEKTVENIRQEVIYRMMDDDVKRFWEKYEEDNGAQITADCQKFKKVNHAIIYERLRNVLHFRIDNEQEQSLVYRMINTPSTKWSDEIFNYLLSSL